MRQRINAIRQNDKGFTLIELLIVIIILGVLAGVVVLAVNGISDRGVNSACKSDIKAVQVASEAYYAKNNKYPTTGTPAVFDMGELVKSGFLHSTPPTGDYTVTATYVPAGSGTPASTVDKVTVTGAIAAKHGGGAC